jgi:hypothetical protein
MIRTAKRNEFLSYVLITAVEGGINYWSAVSDYVPEHEDPEKIGVTVYEYEPAEGETDAQGYAVNGVRVTLDTIAKGIGILDKSPDHYHGGYWSQFWEANRTNGDDGDYDAGIADCILQAGIFGEVVYG